MSDERELIEKVIDAVEALPGERVDESNPDVEWVTKRSVRDAIRRTAEESPMSVGVTWRERIRAAADAVGTAYAFRHAEFKRAHGTGLSIRQIAEAAEMSTTGVHKILGRTGNDRVSLDAEARDA